MKRMLAAVLSLAMCMSMIWTLSYAENELSGQSDGKDEIITIIPESSKTINSFGNKHKITSQYYPGSFLFSVENIHILEGDSKWDMYAQQIRRQYSNYLNSRHFGKC